MKTSILLRLLILVLLAGGLFMKCKDDEQKNKPILPSASFNIKKSELPKLEKEALLGSPDAAFRIYQFYEMYLFDRNKGFYWLTIAAENGHPIGQYNLASDLLEEENSTNQLRARFWLKKAALAGDKEAVNLLKKIEGR